MQPTPAIDVVSQIPVLSPRPVDGNKGSFGKVLVVAGSRGMTGAAVLCASGALRGGAGLVRLAVAEELLSIVATANPCYLTSALPQDVEGRIAGHAEADLLALAGANDVVAVGPGLGRSDGLSGLLSVLLGKVSKPMVLDADGINAFQGRADRLRGRTAPLILTPHPGEFARLLGSDIPTVQARRQELAARFAADHGIILVLKGHATVVTDGRRVYHNTTGNPGMATGGTGDVLTGLIAALLGQGLAPFAAAQLGVHLHGLAGDLARDDLGEASLIATDLLEYLPRAFRGA
jgi:NAD(P)H-hydrate epimerase